MHARLAPAPAYGALRQPTRFDAEFIKRRGFHDQGILVVSLDHPHLTWDQREMLKQVGTKLYGRRPG